MNLSIVQLQHIQSISQDSSALDQFAESLDMSLGEMMEHYELAEQGVGLTEQQYDALFNKPVLSKEYCDLRKIVELLGPTISDEQWGIFADSARSLPANELLSIQNDPLFSGMYGYISEITAERGIW